MEWMCTSIFTGVFLGFGWCFGAYLFSKVRNWLEEPTYSNKKREKRNKEAYRNYYQHSSERD